MRIPLLVLAVSVLAAACGSVSTAVPAGQGDGGNTTDAGAVDAGSGSTGGAGDAGVTGSDAGTSGGGGAADAGSGSGSDGGSGTSTMHTLSVEIGGPNGANGSVSSSPGGISCGQTCSAQFPDGADIVLTATGGPESPFGAWEGGFCSGTNPTCTVHLTRDAHVTAVFQFQPQDPCAGLGPGSVGDPTASAEIQASENLCLTGQSNGDGIVPVGTFSGPMPPSRTAYSFFNPDGSRSGGFVGLDIGVAERASGFMLSRLPQNSSRHEVLAVDDGGNVLASSNSASESYEQMTAHPFGGAVVEALHPGDASAPLFVVWFDDDVKERWRAQLPNDDPVARIGVDRQGNVLVLTYSGSRYGNDALGAVWIDPSGKPGDAFKAGALQFSGTLAPRVGNGFFFQDFNGNWIAQFEPFAGPTAPPDWLAARPKTTLHMARGGRAYAVIGPSTFTSNAASCSTSVEVVAPSGKSCGTAVFGSESSARGNGTSECSSSVTVGYDGTAIQHATSRNLGTCNWKWWTGFFR